MTIPQFKAHLAACRVVYAHLGGNSLVRVTKQAVRRELKRIAESKNIKLRVTVDPVSGHVWLGGLDGEELE